jgi:hypothetical protein
LIIQWCCKGLARISHAEVRNILRDPTGLRCRDWQRYSIEGLPFPIGTAMNRLTEDGLDRHVNDFSGTDPATGLPFCEVTPFISLSAGCVDRDVTTNTNVTHRALRTALEFATTDFSDPARQPCAGWVLYCYVIVGANPAVGIPGVAEEIRELNHNRAFSGWYWQGEVAAKLNVPARQILCAERYEPASGNRLTRTDMLVNLDFCHPAALLAERNML